jgi:immune inhibitor A
MVSQRPSGSAPARLAGRITPPAPALILTFADVHGRRLAFYSGPWALRVQGAAQDSTRGGTAATNGKKEQPMSYFRSFDHGACCAGQSGPTACTASPRVLKNIKTLMAKARVLSAADARMARNMGLLPIPSVGRSGWNDGVIYPLADRPLSAAARSRGALPSAQLSLPKASGTMNCLVLLVDFADNPGTQAASHYEKLLFDRANPGSMATFYHELSYGKLAVQGKVTGWLRAAKPYSHYTAGESGTGTNFPQNTPGLLQEALTLYCKSNSLAPFDLNADGYIDGLFLVHAGAGAEAEPNPNKRADMIWSHKWTLPAPFTNNGVKAFAYFTAPEDGRLGVFAHEFGHFLGLPDLYDTSYRSQGIGDWCLMAGGSWNGNGDVPARMSAWCLATLGWIKPINVKVAATLKLDTLVNDPAACFRLWTAGAKSNEYFLLENRQRKGRDAGLPGSGLALWHVDESQSDNTNPIAYRVALVQADGKRDLELNRNQGDATDLFPGGKKVTKVSDQGVAQPTTRANAGSATRVGLSAIKVTKGIVSVKVKV